MMEKKLGNVYEEISEENAALNTVAEENLAGVRTVKAFAREKFEIRKFLSHNKRYYELNMKQSKVLFDTSVISGNHKAASSYCYYFWRTPCDRGKNHTGNARGICGIFNEHRLADGDARMAVQ